jgi:SAM-dependent methyltransferase
MSRLPRSSRKDSGVVSEWQLHSKREKGMVDIATYNRKAWEAECRKKNPWTVAYKEEILANAKKGKPYLLLTPLKEVPSAWYLPIRDKDVLCLASGGGQQTSQFSAMGARTTVLDNSQTQLDSDITVSKREGLDITTVLGDMRDLSCFTDESFDLIFHPVSNCFVDDIQKVWKECFRVLRKGGRLLVGITNPVMYIFDGEAEEKGRLEVRFPIPFSDTDYPELAQGRMKNNEPLEFSHTLEEQLGGICDAGLSIISLYSDTRDDLSSKCVHDAFLAILAKKN